MKKSLSVLLSVAMMFSVFASFAFGQEAAQTTEAKYQQLVERGIFTGMPDGQAHLDADMTRAQFATVLLRLFELNENVAASNVYNDLDGAGWAAGAIGAATQAGLMQGRGDGVFDPSGSVTVQELAIVLTRAFQLQPSNETIPGIVDDWAVGQVAAAIKAGLITAKANYTAPALRGDLVDSSYTAHQTIAALTEPEVAFSATKATELQVKFSKAVDTSKVEFDVTFGGAKITPASVQWSADNTTATIEFNNRLQQGVYNISVTGATANAVEGSVNIQDEQVARIEVLGDTGSAILVDNDLERVRFHFKVYNQYNEDVTRTSNVEFHSNLGQVDIVDYQKGIAEIDLYNKGSFLPYGTQFTVNGYIPRTAVQVSKMMKLGDEARATTVNVLGLYHPHDETLNVGMEDHEYANFALLLEVKDQYGNIVDDVELLTKQVTAFSNNLSLVDLEKYDDLAHADLRNKILYRENLGENSDQIGVALKKGFSQLLTQSGTATVTFSPIFGGTQATYSFDVGSAQIASTIQLQRPTTTVTRGEIATIPFRALDRNGQEVTKLSGLVGSNPAHPIVSLNTTAGTLKFEENRVTGKAELKLDTTGIVFSPEVSNMQVHLSAFTTSGGSSAQLAVTINEERVPGSVGSVTSEVRTAMLADGGGLHGAGATKIKAEDFVIRDQYGNVMNIFGEQNGMDYSGKYAIELRLTDQLIAAGVGIDSTTGDPSVTNTVYLREKDEYVIIKGGNAKVTANLEVSVKKITASGYEDIIKENLYGGRDTNYTDNGKRNVSLSVVELRDISDFKADPITKPLYTAKQAGINNVIPGTADQAASWYTALFAEELVVYGVSGARKVALPLDIYSVSISERGMAANPSADNTAYEIVINAHRNADGPQTITGANQTKEVPVYVVAVGHDKTVDFTTEVSITNVRPDITEIKVDTLVKVQKDSPIEAIMDKVDVIDNHGMEWPTANKPGSIIVSEFSAGNELDLQAGKRYLLSEDLDEEIGGKAGDSFKVTYISNNGKIATFVVEITN